MGWSDFRCCPAESSFDRLLQTSWRGIVSTGVNSGPPEFKVPSSSERSFIRLSTDMPRSKVDPGETGRLSPGCESTDAEFSILLQGSSFTSQPYGAISILQVLALAPCGLSDSLYTLRRNCFAIHRDRLAADLSGFFVGHAVSSATF